MALASRAHTVLPLTTAAAAVLWIACSSTNVHDTPQAQGQPCFNCHSAAYDNVQTPKHVGVYPQTCNDCHDTTSWSDANGGHPESKFPITKGSHANKAIACTDCHIPSLGSDTGGQNTDCVHCHIGAHTTPYIDSAHTTVKGYSPSSGSTPHSCLGCHPSG
jgi:formate-dependent nitrite reductase cytochrome c552 subunit